MTSPDEEKESRNGGDGEVGSSSPNAKISGVTTTIMNEKQSADAVGHHHHHHHAKHHAKHRLVGNKRGNMFFVLLAMAVFTFLADLRTVKKVSVPSLWSTLLLGSSSSSSAEASSLSSSIESHQVNFTNEENEILLQAAAKLQIDHNQVETATATTTATTTAENNDGGSTTDGTSTSVAIISPATTSVTASLSINQQNGTDVSTSIITTSTSVASTPATATPTTASSVTATNAITTTTTTTSNNNNNINNNNTGLWIHVVEFAEGMAAWRLTFFELLTLAKSLNATLVEPCLVGGRLRSCTRASKTALRLSDAYDLRLARRYHPKIASVEEFIQKTGYNHTSSQVYTKDHPHMFPLYVERRQNELGKLLKTRPSFKRNKQPNFDKAIEHSFNTTTILEIIKIRKWGLNNYQYQGKKLDDTMANRLMQMTIFRPEQFNYVRSLLQAFNIDTQNDKFGVIQWRPEIQGLNYTNCAHAILETRDIISAQRGIPKEKFILISPLSHRKSLQWGGVAGMASRDPTSYPSLQMLLDAGFHKLEQAFPVNVTDGSLLVVWDMITAMMAEDFSSCTGCPKSVCGKCNYQGAASQYTVALRREYTAGKQGKTTNNCWPIKQHK